MSPKHDAARTDVLAVTSRIGRTFTADDDIRDGGKDGPAAGVSYGFWQSEFGDDPQVLGHP